MSQFRNVLSFSVLLVLSGVVSTHGQSKFHTALDVGASMMPNASDVSIRSLSVLVSCGYDLGAEYVAEATAGMTYVHLRRIDFPDAARLDPANIVLGIRKRSLRFVGDILGEIDVRTAVPLAFLRGDDLTEKRLTESNYTTAASAAGWRDPFPWLLNVLPVIIGVEALSAPTEGTTLRYALRPAYLMSLNEDQSRAAVSAELSIEQRLVGTLCLHGGINGWATTESIENNDRVQTSVFLELSAQIFERSFGLGVNVNLDAPYGVMASEKKTTWGLLLRVR